MTIMEQDLRIPARLGFAGGTILDHIKMFDPLDPDDTEQTPAERRAGTVLDRYVPIGEPEDPNEDCYWDKKVIKEKQELERSSARLKAKSLGEAQRQNETAIAESAAKSAVRRSGSPDSALGYYAFFK
jgi:hypothetical protein